MQNPESSIRGYFSALIWLCLLLLVCFIAGTAVQIALRWQTVAELSEPEALTIILPTVVASHTPLPTRTVVANHQDSVTETPISTPTSTATSMLTDEPTRAPTRTLSPRSQPTKTAKASPTVVTTYTIQAGDTLSKIAARLKISLDELRAANPSQQSDSLKIGDVLIIPSEDDSSSRGRGKYTVQSGDSLSKIARQFDISLEALREANPDLKSDALEVGDLIWIPQLERTQAKSTPTKRPTATGTSTISKEYRVRSGDTLSNIANRFGISLDELQVANPNLNPNVLNIGDLILIPEP